MEEIENIIKNNLFDEKCEINKYYHNYEKFLDIIEEIEKDVIYFRSKLNII